MFNKPDEKKNPKKYILMAIYRSFIVVFVAVFRLIFQQKQINKSKNSLCTVYSQKYFLFLGGAGLETEKQAFKVFSSTLTFRDVRSSVSNKFQSTILDMTHKANDYISYILKYTYVHADDIVRYLFV